MRHFVLAIPLLLAPLAPAQSQEADCPAGYVLPSPYQGWDDPQPAASPAHGPAAGSGEALLRPGTAYDLTLLPAADAAYAVAPEREPQEDSFGLAVKLHVDTAGTYRIVLDKPAWIDLVSAGSVLGSVAHGHGPACSGIRKIVDFELGQGDYVIQLSGNADTELRLLTARVEG